jgi:monoamine oxidase
MPSWQTVVITVGASGVAVVGTLLGTWLQLRHNRREQKVRAEAARRERAAQILGRVRTLLHDLDPERMGANVSRKTPTQLASFERRWSPLRDELAVFAAADDDPRVTEAAARLEIAVSNTHTRVARHARDLLAGGEGGPDTYEQARAEHLRATTLVRIVLDLVRRRKVADLEAMLEQTDPD